MGIGRSLEKEHQLIHDMLEMIEEEINTIVTDRRHLLRNDMRRFFPGPWEINRQRLIDARSSVHFLRRGPIEDYGFTLDEARWKKSLLEHERDVGNHKGFLARANIVMGSLSHVIPALEAVKEYKEQVEAAME